MEAKQTKSELAQCGGRDRHGHGAGGLLLAVCGARRGRSRGAGRAQAGAGSPPVVAVATLLLNAFGGISQGLALFDALPHLAESRTPDVGAGQLHGAVAHALGPCCFGPLHHGGSERFPWLHFCVPSKSFVFKLALRTIDELVAQEIYGVRGSKAAVPFAMIRGILVLPQCNRVHAAASCDFVGSPFLRLPLVEFRQRFQAGSQAECHGSMRQQRGRLARWQVRQGEHDRSNQLLLQSATALGRICNGASSKASAKADGSLASHASAGHGYLGGRRQ